MTPNSTVWASAILLCAVVPALADTKIATKYIADGQTTETVIYAKGERLRYSYGRGESLLRLCDQNRIVQVDDNARTYVSLPAEQPAAPASSKIAVTDTGERKEMFGYSARHLKTTETGDDKKERTEIDGWYFDLKDLPACSGVSGATGYPAAYTSTTFAENGKVSSTVAMQVTDLRKDPLEAAMFEIPAGYKDGAAAVNGGPAVEKASGMTRVGAVPMLNKSNHKMPTAGSYGRLLSQLQGASIDVLPLADGAAEAIQAKAGQAHCDYILYTDLVSVEKPATGKVGGLLHKTPIVGRATDGDAFEARLDYRLVPVGEGATPVAASVVAKTGHAFNWVGAAMLASNFIPMTAAARMLGGQGALNPAMINALLKGGTTGSATTSMDPMMSGLSMFLRGANLVPGAAAGAAQNAPGMDAAIAAALDLESKALLSLLKK